MDSGGKRKQQLSSWISRKPMTKSTEINPGITSEYEKTGKNVEIHQRIDW